MARIIAAVLALALPSLAFAAYVDYQGPSGNLNVPGNWYVITDPANPASRTGATGLPVGSDFAYIRNATTTTLNSALNARTLSVGGPAITGVPTQSPTVLDIVSGATLTMLSEVVGGTEIVDAELNIGQAYPATVNLKGGLVTMTTRGNAQVIVGSNPAFVSQMNVSGGSLHIQFADAGNPGVHIGQSGGQGKLLMTGGTIRMDGNYNTTTMMSVGRSSTSSVGKGTLDVQGGLIAMTGILRVGHDQTTGGLGGRGLVQISGGQVLYGYRSLAGDGNSWGHYKITGGTLGNYDAGWGDLWVGRGDGYTGCGKLTYNQSATINLHGYFMGLNNATAPERTWMEVKVNSGADFGFVSRGATWLNGKLEVSFTDGYTPAPGTAWKILDSVDAPTVAFTEISPGFHTEVRTGNDVYLVVDSLRHPGDANNDGAVNVGDLGILAGNWGTPDARTAFFGATWEQGDFNGDDVVNVGDLGILAGNWGWTGTPAGGLVPEPACLTLLVLGSAAMFGRRNRRI